MQVGLWTLTWHSALVPQVWERQGSPQDCCRQAWSRSHSSSTRHSGLSAASGDGRGVHRHIHMQGQKGRLCGDDTDRHSKCALLLIFKRDCSSCKWKGSFVPLTPMLGTVHAVAGAVCDVMWCFLHKSFRCQVVLTNIRL